MCSNGSFVAVVCSLLDIPIPLTTWHRLLRDVTVCECCQKDNSNIFLVRNIVLFSFPFELLDRRLLFCGFRFHVSITHNAGAVLIHGSQYYITLHLILIFPAGMFLCADFVLWTIRIPRRGYCVVFVFSRTLGHASPLVRLNFVFIDSSVVRLC